MGWTKMKYVYQLEAHGTMQMFNGFTKMCSSTVFTTKEAAKKRIEQMKTIVTNPEITLVALNPDDLQIKILQLEIIE